MRYRRFSIYATDGEWCTEGPGGLERTAGQSVRARSASTPSSGQSGSGARCLDDPHLPYSTSVREWIHCTYPPPLSFAHPRLRLLYSTLLYSVPFCSILFCSPPLPSSFLSLLSLSVALTPDRCLYARRCFRFVRCWSRLVRSVRRIDYDCCFVYRLPPCEKIVHWIKQGADDFSTCPGFRDIWRKK